MDSKLTLFLAIVAVFYHHAEGCGSGAGGMMNMQEMQMAAMECAKDDLLFMMQIGEIATNDDPKAKMDFVCHHIPNIVKLVECMVKKVTPCLPDQVKPLMAALPNQERLEDAIGFVCKQKSLLMSQPDCLAPNVENIMQCYQTKIVQVVSVASPQDDPVQLMCRMIHAEEKCIVDYRGSCTTSYVNVLTGMLEKLFPESVCKADHSNTKTVSETDAEKQKQIDIAKQIFGNILVHGEPQGQATGTLRYKPYVIKN